MLSFEIYCFLFNMRVNRIFFLVLIILSSYTKSFTLTKQELRKSLKYSKYFSYYERKYKIPKNLLYSISVHETGRPHSSNLKVSWPWTIHNAGKPYYFNTKLQAINFAKKLIKHKNENFDIGIMQINYKHHKNAFSSIQASFDPKTNIEYGAKFLSNKYKKYGSWQSAISHYHSATPLKGKEYLRKVTEIRKKIDSHRKKIRIAMFAKENPPKKKLK